MDAECHMHNLSIEFTKCVFADSKSPGYVLRVIDRFDESKLKGTGILF
jgi:hypothetical protein